MQMPAQMLPNAQPIRPAGVAYGMDASLFGGGTSGFSTPPLVQPTQPQKPAAFNPNSFSMFGGDNSMTFNAFSGSSNVSNSGTLNPTQSSIPTNNAVDLDFGNLNLGSTNTQPVASSNRNDIDLLFS